ncbi:3-deoxy-D-manno-octulosonic acid transferase [Falsirhodobacter deserti]|uniref:3-deoxy-D-manno-octulosonic acid transferase n=1 Tax=Falsirhodobacter deserti TaxID=1365611 RepID=UPI000FE2CFBE|nr:glycosyltransferase N-terminal domain-containing protein [Falsirhodobacter deserti]
MILYRLLMLLALPVLALVAWRRGGLAERLALRPLPRGAVWVHGASNGELASARSVIAALAQEGPVLVTCNNPTAKVLVGSWGLAGVTSRLAPLDAWPVMRRVLRHDPKALVIVENELWPERILSCATRMPVLMIGARMSDRSARRWARLPLMRRMLGAMSWVSAQDAASEARLKDLGLPARAIGPRMLLKASVAADDAPLPPMPHPREETLLAASTHPGEDEVMLDAFGAQSRFRWLVIAPRHPVRGPDIEALAQARGLTVARRGAGAAPSAQVYVADTLGEMGLWYRAAAVTVIGGSFVPKGGHTPFEPAAHGSALVHGPDVANFTEVFASLHAEGGAVAATAQSLAPLLDGLDPQRQAAMVQAASRALPQGDAAATVLAALRGCDTPAQG